MTLDLTVSTRFIQFDTSRALLSTVIMHYHLYRTVYLFLNGHTHRGSISGITGSFVHYYGFVT